jgi:hypothetical protein
MKIRFARPGPLALAALALVSALAVGTAVRRSGTERRPLPALVDLSPAAVRRIVVETGGRQAELTRHPQGWSAQPGTPPQSAPLLFSAEDKMFPLLAYRSLRADTADPQYGLVEPEAVVRLEDHTGNQVGIRVGAASFSGAGFYAGRDSEPHRVYLVPRSTVDLLRTITIGERTTSAEPLADRADRYDADRQQSGRTKELSTYVRQVVDAGGQPPPPGP